MKKIVLLIAITIIAAGCNSTTSQTSNASNNGNIAVASNVQVVSSDGKGTITNIETPSTATYINNEFGFKITVPTAWRNYRVITYPQPNSSIVSFTFQIPATAPYSKQVPFVSTFTINTTPVDQISSTITKGNLSPVGTYFGKNTLYAIGYVAAVESNQGYPSYITTTANLVALIKNSLTITTPKP